MPSPWKTCPSPSRSDSTSLVNCLSTEEIPHFEEQRIKNPRVLDDFRPVEGWAEHGGMRVLAAQAAAHAAVDHRRHRVAPQGIGVVLEGERRAAREPDAGVVPRAGVLIDAVLDAHDPFTGGDFF